MHIMYAFGINNIHILMTAIVNFVILIWYKEELIDESYFFDKTIKLKK